MFYKRLVSLIRDPIIFNLKRTFTKPPSNETGSLSMKVTRGEEDIDETLDFLEASFVTNEPIIKTFQLEDTCDLLRYLKNLLAGSYVLKVVNEDCDIMSVAVCNIIDQKNADNMRTFAECSTCDPKTKRIINFWADVADSHNMYKCFKVKQLWDISILSTATEAQGKGLSKMLVTESKLVGKKEGLSICRMDCTSYFSAKLADDLKFVTYPPRDVMTYRDKKGCPWLFRAPPAPHGNIIVTYDFLC